MWRKILVLGIIICSILSFVGDEYRCNDINLRISEQRLAYLELYSNLSSFSYEDKVATMNRVLDIVATLKRYKKGDDQGILEDKLLSLYMNIDIMVQKETNYYKKFREYFDMINEVFSESLFEFEHIMENYNDASMSCSFRYKDIEIERNLMPRIYSFAVISNKLAKLSDDTSLGDIKDLTRSLQEIIDDIIRISSVVDQKDYEYIFSNIFNKLKQAVQELKCIEKETDRGLVRELTYLKHKWIIVYEYNKRLGEIYFKDVFYLKTKDKVKPAKAAKTNVKFFSKEVSTELKRTNNRIAKIYRLNADKIQSLIRMVTELNILIKNSGNSSIGDINNRISKINLFLSPYVRNHEKPMVIYKELLDVLYGTLANDLNEKRNIFSYNIKNIHNEYTSLEFEINTPYVQSFMRARTNFKVLRIKEELKRLFGTVDPSKDFLKIQKDVIGKYIVVMSNFLIDNRLSKEDNLKILETHYKTLRKDIKGLRYFIREQAKRNIQVGLNKKYTWYFTLELVGSRLNFKREEDAEKIVNLRRECRGRIEEFCGSKGDIIEIIRPIYIFHESIKKSYGRRALQEFSEYLKRFYNGIGNVKYKSKVLENNVINIDLTIGEYELFFSYKKKNGTIKQVGDIKYKKITESQTDIEEIDQSFLVDDTKIKEDIFYIEVKKILERLEEVYKLKNIDAISICVLSLYEKLKKGERITGDWLVSLNRSILNSADHLYKPFDAYKKCISLITDRLVIYTNDFICRVSDESIIFKTDGYRFEFKVDLDSSDIIDSKPVIKENESKKIEKRLIASLEEFKKDPDDTKKSEIDDIINHLNVLYTKEFLEGYNSLYHENMLENYLIQKYKSLSVRLAGLFKLVYNVSLQRFDIKLDLTAGDYTFIGKYSMSRTRKEFEPIFGRKVLEDRAYVPFYFRDAKDHRVILKEDKLYFRRWAIHTFFSSLDQEFINNNGECIEAIEQKYLGEMDSIFDRAIREVYSYKLKDRARARAFKNLVYINCYKRMFSPNDFLAKEELKKDFIESMLLLLLPRSFESFNWIDNLIEQEGLNKEIINLFFKKKGIMRAFLKKNKEHDPEKITDKSFAKIIHERLKFHLEKKGFKFPEDYGLAKLYIENEDNKKFINKLLEVMNVPRFKNNLNKYIPALVILYYLKLAKDDSIYNTITTSSLMEIPAEYIRIWLQVIVAMNSGFDIKDDNPIIIKELKKREEINGIIRKKMLSSRSDMGVVFYWQGVAARKKEELKKLVQIREVMLKKILLSSRNVISPSKIHLITETETDINRICLDINLSDYVNQSLAIIENFLIKSNIIIDLAGFTSLLSDYDSVKRGDLDHLMLLENKYTNENVIEAEDGTEIMRIEIRGLLFNSLSEVLDYIFEAKARKIRNIIFDFSNLKVADKAERELFVKLMDLWLKSENILVYFRNDSSIDMSEHLINGLKAVNLNMWTVKIPFIDYEAKVAKISIVPDLDWKELKEKGLGPVFVDLDKILQPKIDQKLKEITEERRASIQKRRKEAAEKEEKRQKKREERRKRREERTKKEEERRKKKEEMRREREERERQEAENLASHAGGGDGSLKYEEEDEEEYIHYYQQELMAGQRHIKHEDSEGLGWNIVSKTRKRKGWAGDSQGHNFKRRGEPGHKVTYTPKFKPKPKVPRIFDSVGFKYYIGEADEDIWDDRPNNHRLMPEERKNILEARKRKKEFKFFTKFRLPVRALILSIFDVADKTFRINKKDQKDKFLPEKEFLKGIKNKKDIKIVLKAIRKYAKDLQFDGLLIGTKDFLYDYKAENMDAEFDWRFKHRSFAIIRNGMLILNKNDIYTLLFILKHKGYSEFNRMLGNLFYYVSIVNKCIGACKLGFGLNMGDITAWRYKDLPSLINKKIAMDKINTLDASVVQRVNAFFTLRCNISKLYNLKLGDKKNYKLSRKILRDIKRQMADLKLSVEGSNKKEEKRERKGRDILSAWEEVVFSLSGIQAGREPVHKKYYIYLEEGDNLKEIFKRYISNNNFDREKSDFVFGGRALTLEESYWLQKEKRIYADDIEEDYDFSKWNGYDIKRKVATVILYDSYKLLHIEERGNIIKERRIISGSNIDIDIFDLMLELYKEDESMKLLQSIRERLKDIKFRKKILTLTINKITPEKFFKEIFPYIIDEQPSLRDIKFNPAVLSMYRNLRKTA